MPNHVTNQVNFIGTDEDLQKLREAVKGTDKIFSFNSFYPMPEELDITSPVTIVSEKKYKEYLEKKSKNELGDFYTKPITKKMQDRFIKEYGVDNWYDWRLGNWGTKWDCYDIISDEDFVDSIEFSTAWSTPIRAMLKLSSLFPNVEINVKYYDENIGYNIGKYTLIGGELVEEYEPNTSYDSLSLYYEMTEDEGYFGYVLSNSELEVSEYDIACIKIVCENELNVIEYDIKINNLNSISHLIMKLKNILKVLRKI